jgi:peptide deformylase
MKKHVKIYLDYFGYGVDDFIPCEVCGSRAVDIHHIDCRGMGGSKNKDEISNLQALCRQHHIEYGDKKQYMDFLKEKHNDRLQRRDRKLG